MLAGNFTINLVTVVMAVGKKISPRILVSSADKDTKFRLPAGSFDPSRHRTLHRAVEAFVEAQTGFEPGYIEQLYTFGDAGREYLPDGSDAAHNMSIGYLSLAAPEALRRELRYGTGWQDIRNFFPWEDLRDGPGKILLELKQKLLAWEVEFRKTESDTLRERINIAFGLCGYNWRDDRVLDRYELLYEAGLVAEAKREGEVSANRSNLDTGQMMHADHRRILATALGRIRAKIRYRPVIFRLMPEAFTLSELQHTVEAISGVRLHTQNFRRFLENSALVEPTGQTRSARRGRPAALFQENSRQTAEFAHSGIHIPAPKSF